MTGFPRDPHAMIEIVRPGQADGQNKVMYDTWEHKRLITEVDVELATNQSSEARVTFFDPNYRIIDAFGGETAKATVRIWLGYGQDLGEPVFKGILAQLERGETDTTLVIYDMAFIMKLVKRSGYKNKKDDVDIIRSLVTDNNLEFEGPGEALGLEPNRAMMQDAQSDWDWMVERARDAGLIFYVRHDKVFAKKPAKKAAHPALTVTNRVDFTLESGWDFVYRTPENLEGRAKIVRHRRRGRNGRFIEGTSTEANRGLDTTVTKRDMPNASKAKLTKRAAAQKELDREHAYEGRLEMLYPVGGSRLDVRNTIRVNGIGKRFSGEYLCSNVRYRFAAGKLNLGLELYRDAEVK